MKTERTTMKTPAPVVLMAWTARRAGAAITIEGVDAHGNPHKAVGVAEIMRSDAPPIATDRHGHRFELR